VARARLESEAAWKLRIWFITYLQRMGADPTLRARLAEQERYRLREEQQRADRERREAEERARRQTAADLQGRRTIISWLIAQGADPDLRKHNEEAFQRWQEEQQRGNLVPIASSTAPSAGTTGVEVTVEASLPQASRPITSGIILPPPPYPPLPIHSAAPPPLPPPPHEARPPAPHPSAVWIAGRFTWNGMQWIWIRGHYTQSPAAAPMFHRGPANAAPAVPGRPVRSRR
jgi:hypothetical protein